MGSTSERVSALWLWGRHQSGSLAFKLGSTPKVVIWCCRGAVYLYALIDYRVACYLLPQSVRACLLFLCPRSITLISSHSAYFAFKRPCLTSGFFHRLQALIVSPALQSPFGFPVAFCRSYRLFSFYTVFLRPCLPCGSPVAFRFSGCLQVLPLPSGSPLWFSFMIISFVILLLPLPLQRVRAGDLSPAPFNYAICCLRFIRRTLIISSLKYNSCLPST